MAEGLWMFNISKSSKSLGPIRGRNLCTSQASASISNITLLCRVGSSLSLSIFRQFGRYFCLYSEESWEIQLYLCLIRHLAMMTYVNGGTASTSTLEGGEWSASHTVHFIPSKAPDTIDEEAGLHSLDRRKFSLPCW